MVGEVAGVPGVEEGQQLADLGEAVLGFLQLVESQRQPEPPLCTREPAPLLEQSGRVQPDEQILDPVVEPRVIDRVSREDRQPAESLTRDPVHARWQLLAECALQLADLDSLTIR